MEFIFWWEEIAYTWDLKPWGWVRSSKFWPQPCWTGSWLEPHPYMPGLWVQSSVRKHTRINQWICISKRNTKSMFCNPSQTNILRTEFLNSNRELVQKQSPSNVKQVESWPGGASEAGRKPGECGIREGKKRKCYILGWSDHCDNSCGQVKEEEDWEMPIGFGGADVTGTLTRTVSVEWWESRVISSIEELGTEYIQLLRRFALREIKTARPGRGREIKICTFLRQHLVHW